MENGHESDELMKFLCKFEEIFFIESNKLILLKINSNTMGSMMCVDIMIINRQLKLKKSAKK